MRFKYLSVIFLACALALPMASSAQEQISNADTQEPILTLDEAVSLALQHNRLVKNSVLEVQKYDFQVSTARSRRKPQFQFTMLGGELLHPFDFTFPAGSFGTYPGTGPIPSTNAKIHTPAVFTTYITANADQPLTQQYKIGLGIHLTELGRDIAREDVRAERQKIAAEVRNAYFNLFAVQASVDAAREAVKTFEEAQRVTAQYVSEKTVLRADALDVDARLAKSRYELSVAENGLATQREALNQLLGRDVATPFRVDFIPEQDTSDLTLDSARNAALVNRPEVPASAPQGKASRIRPAPRESRIYSGPQSLPALSGSLQCASSSTECHHGRLFPELGAIRLGAPPQQGCRGNENYRPGTQRDPRDGVEGRRRDWCEVP